MGPNKVVSNLNQNEHQKAIIITETSINTNMIFNKR